MTVRELNAILDDPRTHAEWRSTVAAGGTLSSTEQGYLNTFVVAAKGGSYPYWSSIKVFNVLMGNPTVISGVAPYLVQYKPGTGASNAINHFFLYTDCVETGATGGALSDESTKYLDTGYNVSALSSTSCGVWLYVSGGFATAFNIAAYDGTSYFGMDGNTSIRVSLGGNVSAVTMTPVPTNSFIGGSASGSTTLTGYIDGVAFGTTGAAGSMPSLNPYIACMNNSSVPSNYNRQYTRFYAITSGISANQAAQFYTNVLALETALSRN